MTPKAVIEEILFIAQKVSLEKERLWGIFLHSGIHLDGEMKITGIDGDPLEALRDLMENLSDMAVVKISAKQIIRKSGLKV